jgi:hypothetical protein
MNTQALMFSDSDHAGDKSHRKSRGAHCTTLGIGTTSGGSAVFQWRTNVDPGSPSQSTCEAEYRSTNEAAKTAAATTGLLQEINIPQVATPIMVDNEGAIALAQNPMVKRRSRHIELQYHYIRWSIKEGRIVLFHVPSKMNIADILTKPLSRPAFEFLRAHLKGQATSPLFDIHHKHKGKTLYGYLMSAKPIQTHDIPHE